MRIFMFLILAFAVSTTWAGDKDKEPAKNAKKSVKVAQPYVKNKGKPADPGAHGRANAAAKQAANPGKGSGKAAGPKATHLPEKPDGEKDKKKGDKD